MRLFGWWAGVRVNVAARVATIASVRFAALLRAGAGVAAGALSLAIVAAAPAAPVGASAPQAAIVHLIEEPVVAGGDIRLGEIARIESDDERLKDSLAELVVGKAALPGAVRSLNVGTISIRMRQANLPAAAIEIVADGDAVAVHTRHQLYPADRLAGFVRAEMERALPLPAGARYEVAIEADDHVLPTGDVQLRLAGGAFRWGRSAVPVDIVIDGRVYKRAMVRVEAAVVQDVLIAAAPIARGAKIGAGDVRKSRVTLSAPVQGPVDLGDELRALKHMREGAVLTWESVERAPHVYKGERVVVVAETEGIVISVAGEALADGWVGELVPVRNVESGNALWGRLSEDGTVLVDLR